MFQEKPSTYQTANFDGGRVDDDWDELKWSPTEDSLIVQLSGSGAKPDEISEYLPNRTPLSCRRRYLELHATWSEELQNKAASVPTVDGLHQIEGEQAPDAVPLVSTMAGGRLDISETQDTRAQRLGTTAQLVQEPLNPIANFSEQGISPSGSRVANTATSALASNGTRSISQNDPGSQVDLGGSETSDYTWFDGFALSGACRFPAVESVAVSRLLGSYHAWSQTFGTCHTSTCAEPADVPENSPPGSTPSTLNGSLPQSAETSSSTTLAPRAALQKGGATQKRDREDDDEPKKPRAQKRKRVEDGGLLLACPFHKRYHPKHFFCGKNGTIRGFKTIAQVKQHVRQFHIRPPMHCPRCKDDFDDSQKLAEHIMQRMATQSCEERPFSDETMLPWSANLVGSIKARVDSSLTLREQWFSVWRFLFPNIKEPASCWVDKDVCRHVLDIKRFVIAEGDRVVCISRFLSKRNSLWADRTPLGSLIGPRSYSRKRFDS